MIEMIEDEELRELFRIESEEHIQIIEKGLLDLEKNPKDYETLHLIFREAHSMKGASRMLGISDIESIAHIFEEVLGKASRGEFEITGRFIDTYYEALDAMKNLVTEAVTGEKTDVDVVAILDKLLSNKPEESNVSTASFISKSKEAPSTVEESIRTPSIPNATQAPSPPPVSQPLEEKTEILPEKAIDVVLKEVPPNIPESKKEISEIDKIIESKKASIVNSPPTVTKKEDSKEKKNAEPKKMDTMRVEPAKLDALMVQSGELIVTKNRISNRVKEAGEIQYIYEETIRTILEGTKILTQIEKDSNLSPKIRFLVSQLLEVYEKQSVKFELLGQSIKDLKKVLTHDVTRLSMTALKIERSIYNIRMLSLNNVFTLFHRTVRDLGRETGKNLQLIIEGGESTVDKQILEDLKDPLMHVIRNSIDHGIESKEDRIKAGKPEIATVQLIGKTLSDMVIIEITDDGKGLDVEKIKEKAIQKGLYTLEEIEQFDNKRIFNIIFHHGFSTRSEVSSLSGRGVGMDVVKNFVEKFRGDIETESELGRGTTFRLKLPIKFSTTNVLIVSVANQKFGIPTDNVILTKTIHFQDVFIMEGKNSVMIGNEPIYVVGLENYLELEETTKSKKKNQTSSPCILLKSESMKFALLVDAVIEKNEVIIKSFEGIIKRVRNVTGVTILDSGEVCIILNPKDLVESILKKSSYRSEEPREEDPIQIDKILLLEFTRELMQSQPKPILVVSSGLEGQNQSNVFQILEAGALEVFPKPQGGSERDYENIRPKLESKIKLIHSIPVFKKRASRLLEMETIHRSERVSEKSKSIRFLVIGSSTGGPNALQKILERLPEYFPVPVICIQHISDGFIQSLVTWLNQSSKLKVKIMEEEEIPIPGKVYFPKDHRHLVVSSEGRLKESREISTNGHTPSINIGFQSFATHYGSSTLGVILTGMGDDGANGLLSIKNKGGRTIGESAETCVVYGMPRVAKEMGALDFQLPLEKIAEKIMSLVNV